MTKLRVLDLFSGIGGFSLGLERTGGFETAAFCEYEDFPRQVLAKHWPDVPCFPDVRELKGEDVDGSIDVICGGYPCQPFSQAGKRRGKEDDRHLWPEFSRLVAELRPAWVIGENVAGHISMGLDDVLSDLERQGYACRTFVIPACATGAPHRRDRVWTIASRNDVADADSIRSHRAAKHVIRGCEPSDRQISLFGSFCEVLAGSGGASVGEASDVADADIDERRPLKSCGSGDQRQDDPGGIQGREESTGQSGKRSQLGTVADASELQRDGSAEYRKQGQRQIQKSGKRGRAQLMADASGVNAQGQQSSSADTQKRAQPRERSIGSRRYGVGRGRPEPGMGGMADGLPAGMDGPCRWLGEPDISRVAKGVKNRANRLKALGNAVVPQVVEMIGRTILEAEKQEE